MSEKMELGELIFRAESGQRLSLDDGCALLEQADLLELGRLASLRRQALHGNRVSYVVNFHLNPSNICENRCRFCAFRHKRGEAGAYEMTLEQAFETVERQAPRGVREIHIVGALNPNLTLDYYVQLLDGLRQRFPQVSLKAFTAVEIAFLSRTERVPVEAVLKRLADAGLEALTGGGAETLSPRVRSEVCPEKLDGTGYLEVHRQAHRLGLRSTATLLFGHVETPRERLDHLCRLRALQDETGGFTAFVPLVFHPEHTELAHLPRIQARPILEMVALARLLLDNIPNIKAYWISMGTKLAQTALAWGANDLDGTVVEERIHHSAGAASPQALTQPQLCALIREAGFEPVERDALHRLVGTAPPAVRTAGVPAGEIGVPASDEVFPLSNPTNLLQAVRTAGVPAGEMVSSVQSVGFVQSVGSAQSVAFSGLLPVADGSRRLTPDEAADLLEHGDLIALGQAAHRMRLRLHPEPWATFSVDRNINTTNACASLCGFCAFARRPESPDAWTLDRETLAAKIEELCAVSERLVGDNPGTNVPRNIPANTSGNTLPALPPAPPRPIVLMQGGMSPDLTLAWYEDLFRWMRASWPSLYLHALSAPEILYLAREAGTDVPSAIRRLRDAGLDSVPGAGAEILSDRVRAAWSPRKCTADEWIGVMREVHRAGLKSSATMVIGLGETAAERVEHFERIRALQDETGGFTAFIHWTFQPGNTVGPSEGFCRSGALPHAQAGAWDYLRTLAVARLYLDNVPNLQASWVTQGRDIAQLALLFGANDLGSTMLEENVVAAAGTRFSMSPDDLRRLAEGVGFQLRRRDFFYRLVG
ncbi:MAG TPA: aminofutalosine synthase MqnE [Candidatus Sumerlaeota bacterium]|nr:aminofutalosine synthase MqnE [Candidatus Sumerlaeota bacterium]